MIFPAEWFLVGSAPNKLPFEFFVEPGGMI